MTHEIIVYVTVRKVYNRLTGLQDKVVTPIGKIILLPDGTIEYVRSQG